MSDFLHFSEHTLQEVALIFMACVYVARVVWYLFRKNLSDEGVHILLGQCSDALGDGEYSHQTEPLCSVCVISLGSNSSHRAFVCHSVCPGVAGERLFGLDPSDCDWIGLSCRRAPVHTQSLGPVYEGDQFSGRLFLAVVVDSLVLLCCLGSSQQQRWRGMAPSHVLLADSVLPGLRTFQQDFTLPLLPLHSLLFWKEHGIPGGISASASTQGENQLKEIRRTTRNYL